MQITQRMQEISKADIIGSQEVNISNDDFTQNTLNRNHNEHNLKIDTNDASFEPLEQQDDVRVRFNELHPAEEKLVKHGALEFDIKLGWVPKAQITGPIPISFSHPDMDDLLLERIDSKSLIYLGYRPTNSFDIHRKFYNSAQNYPFNQFHLCKSQFLERFFRKYYSDFEFDQSRKEGMVSKQSPLIFDSCFEGGNLDAVYFEDNEYRLVARVDSNTKGHCNYYYFKVKCNQPGRYIFRFVNLSKPKSLYQRGMKPYIRVNQKGAWAQGSGNVRYGPSKLNEQYDLSKKIYYLKFDYEFTNTGELVQFCYGIPYTYSTLLKQLNTYRAYPYFHLNKLCYTLSGIEIPLITITEPEREQNTQPKKYVIGLSARVHPGETHASHVLTGFLKALLSSKPEAQMLRKNIIFKIIPMVNPDGVIIGNTRTSISGKDLNRVYSDKTDFVFPEIIGIRDFTKKMKQKYGSSFLFFIDLHGHSTRKNSFFFGPEYSVFDEEYPKCRMLAKIYANITDIFRYYSCKFRLSSFKQKTCRGFFNSNNIVRTYTFQTSMHCYFNFEDRADQSFDQVKLEQLGESLMQAIHGYVKTAIKLEPIKIEQPIDKKKMYYFKRVASEKQQQNSDDMESDKADSQDSFDDLTNNQLQIFYNRVNENRQYFYEELMQFNNIPFTRTEKKKKNNNNEPQPKNIEEVLLIQPQKQRLPDESWKKTTKTRSDWVPKFVFEPRKKQFVSYQKLSNVVFGSASDLDSIIQIKNNLMYSSRPSFPELSKSKYTFINPILDEGLSKKSFSLSQKTQQFKSTAKPRFFKQKQPKEQHLFKANLNDQQLIKSGSSSQLNYHSIESEINFKSQTTKARNLYDLKDLQQIIFSTKNYTILTENQSKRMFKQDLKTNGQLPKSIQKKTLPRKKSIKSFRNSEQKARKRVVKNMSQKGLATRLPCLEKVIKNY